MKDLTPVFRGEDKMPGISNINISNRVDFHSKPQFTEAENGTPNKKKRITKEPETQKQMGVTEGSSFFSTDVPQQQAYKKLQEFKQIIGIKGDIPALAPNIKRMEDKYPDLKEKKKKMGIQADGIMEMADTLLEMSSLFCGDNKQIENLIYDATHESLNGKTTVHPYQNFCDVFLSIAKDKDKDKDKDRYSVSALDIIQFLNQLCESKDDCDNNPENLLSFFLMIVKLFSYCHFNKINKSYHYNFNKILSSHIYMDFCLARDAVDDAFFYLSLKPDQMNRWLKSLLESQFANGRFLVNTRGKNRILIHSNYFLWSHSKADYILGEKQKMPMDALDDYKLQCYIPEVICNMLFHQEGKGGAAGVADSVDGASSACAAIPSSHITRFSTYQCDSFIGEEFEFWFDDNKRSVREIDFLKYLDNYQKAIEKIIRDHGINAESKVERSTYKKEDESERPCLHYSIGTWEAKVFQDLEDTLEIITTPYKLNQKFSVKNYNCVEKYSAAKMFDYFIFPITRDLSLVGKSGHKHFDVIPSLSMIPELLFRIVVDVENNAWIPKALDRLDRMVEVFPYAVLSRSRIELLTSMVAAANNQIKSGRCEPRRGSFSDILDLSEFMNSLKLNDKCSPCALHHLKDAEHTVDINKEPTSTIEFRVPHCPRDGHESFLISNLLSCRISYLNECMNRREQIPFTPIDPKSYKAGKDREVVEHFEKYVRECGLDPATYNKMLRIDVPK
ncbi:hypothetical protein [Endozoicomonas sp.]|uniref:hypothetical protein n=1 Tax=Endozoicomonas sp. TaxID=1892382 RepID=UPI003839E18D